MDVTAAPTLSQLTAIIAAVGALGTAAFGLVDALKALPGGGISLAGFKFIRQAVLKFLPDDSSSDKTGLSFDSLLLSLQSQWINGTATSDQVSIAKSLIKLRLTRDTAAAMANAAGVDRELLREVARKINSGESPTSAQSGEPLTSAESDKSLTLAESDVYGRFDLVLTTLLDQAYQRADQRYRNVAKVAAIPVSVALALVAAKVAPNEISYPRAVLVGLIATPIATIAKDLSTAITNGVQAIQSWKR
jgi:hypothetical protein